MGGPRWHFPKWLLRDGASKVGLTKVDARWVEQGGISRAGRAGCVVGCVVSGGVAHGGNGGWEDGVLSSPAEHLIRTPNPS